MDRTWEQFKNFHFNHFIYELYWFRFSAEQQKSVDDDTSEVYKKMVLTAWNIFERTRVPALRFQWALISFENTGTINHNQEIKYMLEEIDTCIAKTRGK